MAMVKKSEMERAVGEGALPTLRAVIQRCHISGSVLDAVACGDGACVEILACLIENVRGESAKETKKRVKSLFTGAYPGMSPKCVDSLVNEALKAEGVGSKAGVSVRGGASVLVAHCGLVGNPCGVSVDHNFAGDVLVEHCVFLGNRHDSFEAQPKLSVGFWSKPMHLVDKRVVASTAQMPSIAALDAEFQQARVVAAQTADGGRPPPVAAASPFAVPNVGCSPPHVSCNPARQTFATVRESYYPIGNTWGADLLAHSGADGPPLQHGSHSRVALLACGDVRNAAVTCAAWWERQGSADVDARLSLTLNDASSSVLVRDAVLLELMVTRAAPVVVAAVWGSLALDDEADGAMREALDAVAGPWPAWLDADCRPPDWSVCVSAFQRAAFTAAELLKVVQGDEHGRQLAVELTCRAVGNEHRDEVGRYSRSAHWALASGERGCWGRGGGGGWIEMTAAVGRM